MPLPEWLVVHDLDDLEDKLAQVVVVVLGVAFLGQAVTWDGQRELLGFGVATALVIAALAFHLRSGPSDPLRGDAEHVGMNSTPFDGWCRCERIADPVAPLGGLSHIKADD